MTDEPRATDAYRDPADEEFEPMNDAARIKLVVQYTWRDLRTVQRIRDSLIDQQQRTTLGRYLILEARALKEMLDENAFITYLEEPDRTAYQERARVLTNAVSALGPAFHSARHDYIAHRSGKIDPNTMRDSIGLPDVPEFATMLSAMEALVTEIARYPVARWGWSKVDPVTGGGVARRIVPFGRALMAELNPPEKRGVKPSPEGR